MNPQIFQPNFNNWWDFPRDQSPSSLPSLPFLSQTPNHFNQTEFGGFRAHVDISAEAQRIWKKSKLPAPAETVTSGQLNQLYVDVQEIQPGRGTGEVAVDEGGVAGGGGGDTAEIQPGRGTGEECVDEVGVDEGGVAEGGGGDTAEIQACSQSTVRQVKLKHFSSSYSLKKIFINRCWNKQVQRVRGVTRSVIRVMGK